MQFAVYYEGMTQIGVQGTTLVVPRSLKLAVILLLSTHLGRLQIISGDAFFCSRLNKALIKLCDGKRFFFCLLIEL